MTTPGLTLDGPGPLRATSDTKAGARSGTEHAAGQAAGRVFSDLFASEVDHETLIVDVVLPHPGLLVEPAPVGLPSLPAGTNLPGGGKVLPPMHPLLPVQADAAAAAVSERLEFEALVRLERMPAGTVDRAGRALHGGDGGPEQLSLPLAQAPAASRTASVPGAMPTAPLTPGQPGFEQALGQRLVVMVQQGIQHARVSIHPEHLGPMEIRMKIDGEGAHLVLQSPHAAVRDALEQALPRLRDMLGEGGLELVDVDVGDSDRQAAERGSGNAAAHAGGDHGGDAVDEDQPRPLAAPRGLLDTFA